MQYLGQLCFKREWTLLIDLTDYPFHCLSAQRPSSHLKGYHMEKHNMANSKRKAFIVNHVLKYALAISF